MRTRNLYKARHVPIQSHKYKLIILLINFKLLGFYYIKNTL